MRNIKGNVAIVAVATTLAAWGIGCAQPSSTQADSIAQALEEVSGGLEMTDDASTFDLSLDIVAAAPTTDELVDDTIARAPEVIALEIEGATQYNVALAWGQWPVHLDAEEATDWNGMISVNRGAIVVRRRIGFDSSSDRILPRSELRRVDISTRTHHQADGLVVSLYDPEPESPTPLRLTYQPAGGLPISFAVNELGQQPVAADIDDRGNSFRAASRMATDSCQHGFLRGRWQALRDDLGYFWGGVQSADGALMGYVRGIYGQAERGERAMFGKYVDMMGRFRGVFIGSYSDGAVHGKWLIAGGEAGVLNMVYVAGEAGISLGVFSGMWAENRCDSP